MALSEHSPFEGPTHLTMLPCTAPSYLRAHCHEVPDIGQLHSKHRSIEALGGGASGEDGGALLDADQDAAQHLAAKGEFSQSINQTEDRRRSYKGAERPL